MAGSGPVGISTRDLHEHERLDARTLKALKLTVGENGQWECLVWETGTEDFFDK